MYPGYTNTGLRLGQYSKSAGNGGMAFVADNLRTGVYGNSTPILSIHSTAAAGAGGRRTALDFMGNGEGWRFFSAQTARVRHSSYATSRAASWATRCGSTATTAG